MNHASFSSLVGRFLRPIRKVGMIWVTIVAFSVPSLDHQPHMIEVI